MGWEEDGKVKWFERECPICKTTFMTNELCEDVFCSITCYEDYCDTHSEFMKGE